MPLYDGGRIDFHTHVLPCVDDGSRSVHESVQMVRTLAASGVTGIVLTPHFYPSIDSPEAFTVRRTAALAKLKDALASADFAVPTLSPGAEIEYFEGVSVIAEHPELRIGRSGCILLEMPMGRWSSYIVDDILDLCAAGYCRVILAHVERYLFDQPRSTVNALLENGVLMQSNASFFTDRRTSGKAIRALKKGLIHLLGTDAHNMTVRPPNLGEACSVIEERAGKEIAQEIMQGARYLLRADLAAGVPHGQTADL